MPLVAVSIFAFAASMAGKFLADEFLTQRVPIVGSFVGLHPSLNPGVAFGLRIPGAFQTYVIVGALLIVVFLARKATGLVAQTGFGLILGGALGNLVDRLGDGSVTDFFQVGSFPIFNVADTCITVGVVLLLVDSLFLKPKKD